jgi:hypothetical protein
MSHMAEILFKIKTRDRSNGQRNSWTWKLIIALIGLLTAIITLAAVLMKAQ